MAKYARQIRIIGEINEAAYRKFSREMAILERENSNAIHIELNSSGGSTYDALAFKARIEMSKCDVHIVGVGLVASAAVIILACCSWRLLHADSWVMVHEDSGKINGDVATLEVEAKHMRRMETQWCVMLESLTAATSEEWAELHKNTTYLSADECYERGLIDDIV